MAVMSFIDDNVLLGHATLNRDFSEIEQTICQKLEKYTYSFQEDDSIYAIDITKNTSLSDIYKMDCYVVRFVLLNINTLHAKKQEKSFIKLFEQIKIIMGEQTGYYNLRIPTHFVDAIKAYNKIFSNVMLCGGTVEWVGKKEDCDIIKKEDVEVFWATESYINKHKKRLLEIALASFQSYQGQYHISDITSEKAGIIYEKWLENSFDNYKNNVVVVEFKGTPISFVLYGITDRSVEAVLGAVDENYRKYGAYKTMITFGMNEAYSKNKFFVTSTQFDNFIVQGVWAGLGLKPFYSIYNVHVDARINKEN